MPCSVGSAPNWCNNTLKVVAHLASALGTADNCCNSWCGLLLALTCIWPCTHARAFVTTWSFSEGWMLQVLYTTRPPHFKACTEIHSSWNEMAKCIDEHHNMQRHHNSRYHKIVSWVILVWHCVMNYVHAKQMDPFTWQHGHTQLGKLHHFYTSR